MATLKSTSADQRDPLDPVIVAELKRIAANHMRKERPNHTLQPTALVNEAYVRLAQSPEITWETRSHFLAVASQVMRRILVDHARARVTGKRGGPRHQVTLSDVLAATDDKTIDILSLDEALNRLAAMDARQARVVEMHFFAGLSFSEIGLLMNLSERTIKRDWSMARVWLYAELSKSGVT